ncbi:MAG: hypothetical protein AAFN12_19670 [Cyanobacteria bacterium J06560_2]
MHLKESQYLDLDKSYPCPSCKQGSLIPITLTEAWGCDRCKQIFELKAEPNTIGKLTTPYPRQRQWKWNGKHWVLSKNSLKSTLNEASVWVKFVLPPLFIWALWNAFTLAGLSISISALILLALVVMFWVVLWR